MLKERNIQSSSLQQRNMKNLQQISIHLLEQSIIFVPPTLHQLWLFSKTLKKTPVHLPCSITHSSVMHVPRIWNAFPHIASHFIRLRIHFRKFRLILLILIFLSHAPFTVTYACLCYCLLICTYLFLFSFGTG